MSGGYQPASLTERRNDNRVPSPHEAPTLEAPSLHSSPPVSLAGRYAPLDGLAHSLDVLLDVTVEQSPLLRHAQVWVYREKDGLFLVSSLGAAEPAFDDAVRRYARGLMEKPEPCLEPVLEQIGATTPDRVLGRALTDRFDVPRAVLVLTLPAGVQPGIERALADPVVTKLIDQSQRYLRTARDREEADDSLRLAELAREVVRTASVQLDLDQALERCAEPLRKGFGASGVRLRSYATSVLAESGSPSLGAPAELNSMVHRLSHRLWSEQRSVQVVREHHDIHLLSEREHTQFRTFLDLLGWGRALVAPIGSGHQCLGHLALGRPIEGSPWTREEEITVLEIGQDLGRAVLNGRAFGLERQMVSELRELDAYKSDLIESVSHHLRNPLATIVGHLELTSGEPQLTEEVRQSLDRIGRGSQRLHRVVDDLLLFAQVGDPRHPVDARPVDLDRLVHDVADLAAVSVRQSNQRLSILTGDGPSVALGDAQELDRLVSNLVSNAVKYTPNGGRIQISLAPRGHEIEISVSDEGIGISEADQEQLFSEFFRSTNPRALSRPGTGLGLAIVSRITARHGGRVEFESEIDVGSTFRVVLPKAALPPTGAAGRR